MVSCGKHGGCTSHITDFHRHQCIREANLLFIEPEANKAYLLSINSFGEHDDRDCPLNIADSLLSD